jgi:hypothetical protein
MTSLINNSPYAFEPELALREKGAAFRGRFFAGTQI